jgi:hypothetical protein
MATSTQEAPSLRAKRAPAPSKKLTDTSNTARPELSAHSAAIALKRAEDAQRLADQQQLEEQNSTPSGPESESLSLSVNAETVRSVSPAKRPRDESKALSSDAEDNSSASVLEKPKSR